MIKVSTGFVAKSVLATGMAALASYGIVQNWSDVTNLASATTGGLGRIGDFVKTTGILSVIGGLGFILLKFNIVKVLTIQEGETGLLVRRGKVVIDKKTGLPRIVNADRYQVHVAIFRHIAVVNNRERTLHLGSLPVTVEDETWVAPLVVNWSIRGDAVSMRDALTKVSDGNRFDEKFEALEAMIREQCIAALPPAFAEARLMNNGSAPVIDYSVIEEDLLGRTNRYGCGFHELLQGPMHRGEAQHNKDGMIEIAKAVEELAERLDYRVVLPVAS